MNSPHLQTGDAPRRIASRYRVERLLGRGGFGSVYAAYDELLGRVVAVKVIRRDIELGRKRFTRPLDLDLRRAPTGLRSFGPSTEADDQLAQAFRDEFRLLTQLRHPNLANVYDFGRCVENDALFFTQELVLGESLEVALLEAPRATIAELFVQLARALDYIHALGFVHGDLKPSNVLVTGAGPDGQPRAKIIDFGLARMLRGPAVLEDGLGEGPDSMVIGTPGFTAPEHVRGEVADARSDIYALAASLYAAILGRRSFEGKTFDEVLREQNAWRPELAGPLLERTGPVVAELVGRMLEPDPSRRPYSARSIVLELLRREVPKLGEHQRTAQDRREFARIMAEHLPFVDRGGHLARLLERAARVLRPHADDEPPPQPGARGRHEKAPRTVIFRAPEGSGKARLMSELRREVQLGDALFVEGSAWVGSETPLGAFGPIVVQLATALGDRSDVVRRHGDLVMMARKRQVEPSVARQVPEFLVGCARELPFVMHIADLSRGGEDLRLQIDQVCRAIDRTDAAILFCITTEPHGRVAEVSASLCRDQVAESWGLRAFTGEEMQDILRGILGDAPVLGELQGMLSELTGGHPLTFRETLRVLIEEGVLMREAESWALRTASTAAVELQATLAQRSQARLDGLGPEGWNIASVLFLLESPIEEARLADLVGLPSDTFLEVLDRLEDEGLVSRNPASGESVVQLAHQSVREAVRARQGPQLVGIRRDLARRMAVRENGDPQLVFHRSRLVDDASEGLDAVETLERAAEILIGAKRHRLAARVLERLVARLRRFGGVDHLPRLLQAQLQLLSIPGALEDPATEASHYRAGILVAELLGDHRARARFWLGLADQPLVRAVTLDPETKLRHLDEAAEAAEQSADRALELCIANRRAEVLLGAGEVEHALHWSRRAMAIVDLEDASVAEQSRVIGVHLRCLALLGRFDEARALHERAKPVALASPVSERQSYLSGIAYLAVMSGEPGRAVAENEAALAELEDAGLPHLTLTPLHNLGDLRLHAGDLEGAAAAFTEAIEQASVHGLDYHLHLNRGFLGYVKARRGEVGEGASLLAAAKAAMSHTSGVHLALYQLRLLDAEVAHLMGLSAQARRELEEMLAHFQVTHETSLARWARDALARVEHDVRARFVQASPAAEPASEHERETVQMRRGPTRA